MPQSQVLWNGAALPTMSYSETSLEVMIPASDLATAGTAQVSITNPHAPPSVSLPVTVIDAVAQGQ